MAASYGKFFKKLTQTLSSTVAIPVCPWSVAVCTCPAAWTISRSARPEEDRPMTPPFPLVPGPLAEPNWLPSWKVRLRHLLSILQRRIHFRQGVLCSHCGHLKSLRTPLHRWDGSSALPDGSKFLIWARACRLEKIATVWMLELWVLCSRSPCESGTAGIQPPSSQPWSSL